MLFSVLSLNPSPKERDLKEGKKLPRPNGHPFKLKGK
jgi:hypothetical protein